MMAKIDAFEKCLTPPVKMPDYAQGKIYKITSPHTDKVYVGSTVQDLKVRFTCHVSASKTDARPCTASLVIKAGLAKIELLEACPCASKKELERREGELQKITANCCNKVVAGRTDAEYRVDHKVEIAEYRADHKVESAAYQKIYQVENHEALQEQRKNYRAENVDVIRDRKKNYYDTNRDTILKRNKDQRVENNDHIKEQYAANRDTILKKQKAYRAKNRDAILEKQRQYRLRRKAEAAAPAQNITS